jgi:hypothetical protein
MKVKYILIVIISVLLVISISQIFTIPPYAGDIYGIYKSGYFSELDSQFSVIKDAFTGIMMMGKPVYGWIFLEDVMKNQGMKIKVYNSEGKLVPAPGETAPESDGRVIRVINSIDPKSHTEVFGLKYFSAMPVFLEDRCRFCHERVSGKNLAGVMTFERPYSAAVYYSAERMIIFMLISIALLGSLVLVIRWDPEKHVKELFDK